MDVRVDGDSVHMAWTAQGEAYFDEVVQADIPGQSMPDWGERLRSNLVDFVAESVRLGTESRRHLGRAEGDAPLKSRASADWPTFSKVRRCHVAGAKPYVPRCDRPSQSRGGRYASVDARAECASNAHDIAAISCEDRPRRRAIRAQFETAAWTCATTSLASSALRRK